MADIIKEVKTIDVQLIDANREGVRTYKIDNPKTNLTKAEVSTAFQTALANEWLIVSNGNVAKYIGDVTLNTSTKVILGGSDYYITPSSLEITSSATVQVTVSGAYIQGYNLKNNTSTANIGISISENGLVANVGISGTSGATVKADLILVIQGVEVTVPITGHI